MNLPNQVKIIDIIYSIEYVDKPSDVDIFRRESLWGQCDYWTRTIRIYKNDQGEAGLWQTLWHEIIHAIGEKLHITTSDGRLDNSETAIDLLATGVNAVLQDNAMLKREASG